MNTLYTHFPSWMSSKGNDQDVVLFTRLSLKRNSEEFLFPHIFDTSDLPVFLSRCNEAARKMYHKPLSKDLSEKDTDLFAERLYILSQTARGKQIHVSQDGNSALLVNAEEHFSLIEISAGFSPLEQFKILEQRDEILEQYFAYAVSMHWGYLLSRFDRVGNGLQIDVFLHLPALSTQDIFTKSVERALRNGCNIDSFGDRNTPFGQLFRLSSSTLLGTSEHKTLEKLSTIVQEFVHSERNERIKLKESGKVEFIDQLWRDLAILQNCRVLSFKEAFSRFSTVRMGACLEILPVSPSPIPFFASQPAHLRYLSKISDLAEHENHEKHNNQLRAGVFRRLLKGL